MRLAKHRITGFLRAVKTGPCGHDMPPPEEWARTLSEAEALFWDYGSLYQRPRTKPQNEAFGRALRVMGDLYASAIGTVVLQSPEIPARPPEYDGCIQLFGQLHAGAKATLEERIREDLQSINEFWLRQEKELLEAQEK